MPAGLRRFISLTALLSLLLFIGNAILWLRALRTSDEAAWVGRNDTHADAFVASSHQLCPYFSLRNDSTALTLDWGRSHFVSHDGLPIKTLYWQQPPPLVRWETWGHALSCSITLTSYGPMRTTEERYLDDDGTSWSRSSFCISHWLIAWMTGFVPPLWLAARWCKPRRRGICLTCGYDLRASREICPECGTPVPKPAIDSATIAARLKNLQLSEPEASSPQWT